MSNFQFKNLIEMSQPPILPTPLVVGPAALFISVDLDMQTKSIEICII